MCKVMSEHNLFFKTILTYIDTSSLNYSKIVRDGSRVKSDTSQNMVNFIL